MALTPEDVNKKLFTTVRLREGYEQTEVDEFLDEVEAELTRLLKENADLRSQTVAGAVDAGVAAKVLSPVVEAAPAPEAVRPSVLREPPEPIVVRTTGDVSAAAAKVLEMAQRTAEQYVGEARAEADQLLADAKDTAEQLNSEARTKADAIDRETHERTTELERQLDEQRRETLTALQDEKRRLESEVETLRSFEREYRGRLRTFLRDQLEQLAARDGDTPLAPAGGPDTSDAPVFTTDAADGLEVDADERDDAESDDADSEDAAGGRRGRAALDALADDDDHDDAGSTAAPRSALGRILDEEERNTTDPR